MEVKIIELGDNYIKMVIKGEDHTFLNLLQHYLAEDDDVVLAKYNIPHPLVGDPELYVKTNGADPIEVIKRANEKIIKICDILLKQI
ncbi:DNA-directed RNA polymerase subunit L [Archaeoglobales archaeon]|nr:MAG: DNA-directed RNA polymerase subunit L [Archaeoglobales archaeon]